MEDQDQSSMDVEDTWEDLEQDHQELKAGQKIGRFMIIEQIGKGGMGVVYKAYDPELDRKVALKLITAAPKKSETDSVPHARLLREAKALAKLSHPNVVSIFDVGSYGKSVYIAMEFVQGSNLRKWIEQQHPTEKEIVETYIAAGRGLACAHEAGLIHRDFKPDNVMIADKGRVRILDFGLARATELTEIGLPELSSAKLESLSPEQPLLTPLTREGAYIGTLLYMAPEQFLQTDIDQRTDQFSFCVSLFEALFGRRPFRGNNAGQLRKNVLLGNIQVPEDKHVSTWLQKIVIRGLAVDPEDRYSNDGRFAFGFGNRPGRRRQAQKGTQSTKMDVNRGFVVLRADRKLRRLVRHEATTTNLPRRTPEDFRRMDRRYTTCHKTFTGRYQTLLCRICLATGGQHFEPV